MEDFVTIYDRNISSALELFQIFFNFSSRATRRYNQRKEEGKKRVFAEPEENCKWSHVAREMAISRGFASGVHKRMS